MIRKLQSIALLAGALLALSGLMASAAAAHTPAKFTSEAGFTKLTGEEGTYKIEMTGIGITCGILEFSATLKASEVEEVTVIPTLTECKTSLGVAVSITGLGHFEEEKSCQLVLKANGTGDLVCPPGVEVTIDAGPCSVHMPSQSGVKTFGFTNVKYNGVNAIEVDMNLDTLHGTHTDGFLCPFNGGGTFTNTKASGAGIVFGEDEVGNPVGITWDATTP